MSSGKRFVTSNLMSLVFRGRREPFGVGSDTGIVKSATLRYYFELLPIVFFVFFKKNFFFTSNKFLFDVKSSRSYLNKLYAVLSVFFIKIQFSSANYYIDKYRKSAPFLDTQKNYLSTSEYYYFKYYNSFYFFEKIFIMLRHGFFFKKQRYSAFYSKIENKYIFGNINCNKVLTVFSLNSSLSISFFSRNLHYFLKILITDIVILSNNSLFGGVVPHYFVFEILNILFIFFKIKKNTRHDIFNLVFNFFFNCAVNFISDGSSFNYTNEFKTESALLFFFGELQSYLFKHSGLLSLNTHSLLFLSKSVNVKNTYQFLEQINTLFSIGVFTFLLKNYNNGLVSTTSLLTRSRVKKINKISYVGISNFANRRLSVLVGVVFNCFFKAIVLSLSDISKTNIITKQSPDSSSLFSDKLCL